VPDELLFSALPFDALVKLGSGRPSLNVAVGENMPRPKSDCS
jgi:hypothetical protein